MKKNPVLVFSFLLSLLFIREASAIDVGVNVEVWPRATVVLQNNLSKATTLNRFSTARMSVERGYLTVQPKVTDKVTGRLTLDFYTDSDSKGWIAGAGMKLKYAYLQMEYIPEHMFLFGLQKTLFGFINDWNYDTAEKDLADRNKVVKSADESLTLSGYLPLALGEYGFQVANGEGYETSGTNLNLHPAYIANLRLYPVSGIMLGGSAYYQWAGKTGKEVNNFFYTVYGKFSYGPASLMLQWIGKDVQSATVRSSYTTGMYWLSLLTVKFRDIIGVNLDLVASAQFDNPDAADNTWAKSHDGTTTGILGLNVNTCPDAKGNPQVVYQLQWERSMPDYFPATQTPLRTPTDMFLFQVKIVTGATISN